MTIKMAALGPPGTGKTTFSISMVDEWIGAGIPTTEIGYLAFTRAAAEEAARRVGGGRFDDETFPYFRTIHSLCYRLMHEAGLRLKVLKPGHMKAFAKETGLAGEYAVQDGDDLAEAYQTMKLSSKSEWDHCRTAYTLTRLAARTVEDLDRSRAHIDRSTLTKMGWGDEDAYRTFVSTYERWKRENDLLDFTDMLEHVVRHPVVPAIRRVIVDEAQDLAPIHFAIMNRLFDGSAEEFWMVGDDDQAIFSFSGASSEEFLSQIRNCKKVILRQTHRFSSEVVDLSARIIRRVRARIEKNVIGKPDTASVIEETGEFEYPGDGAFVLHRHVRGCYEIVKRLMLEGLPFINERGRSPLSSSSRIVAWRTLDRLAKGEKVSLGSFVIVLEDLMRSFIADPKTGVKTRFVVHGAKKRLSDMGGGVGTDVSLADLALMKVLTPDGATAISARNYGALNHAEDLAYYDRLAKNGYEVRAAGPVITTIHGSKGRETDHVIVFTEMSKRCWQDPDGEHRLAYVAATRTKHRLTICHEKLLDWATMYYHYPIEQAVAAVQG